MEVQKPYGYLYCHTNLINGKKYWGACTQYPTLRWGLNGYAYKNTKFGKDIEKFGWKKIAWAKPSLRFFLTPAICRRIYLKRKF